VPTRSEHTSKRLKCKKSLFKLSTTESARRSVKLWLEWGDTKCPLKGLWSFCVCNWVVLLLLFARFLSQKYSNALASETAKTEESWVGRLLVACKFYKRKLCCPGYFMCKFLVWQDTHCPQRPIHTRTLAHPHTRTPAHTLCYMVSNFACCRCQLTSHLHAHAAVEQTLLPLHT